MADNVAITAGSGTTIATDQIAGAEHYQRVKLADGTADSTTPIVGNSSGLFVSADMLTVASTPVIDTAVYADGDRLGAISTLAVAARNGGHWQLLDAVLEDLAPSTFTIELWLFGVSPTLVNADNGAFSITKANQPTAKFKGKIDFLAGHSTLVPLTSTIFRTIPGSVGGAIGGPLLTGNCESADTNLYGVMRARGAYDAVATSDLTYTLRFRRF